MFGYSAPNVGINQSELAYDTRYFTIYTKWFYLQSDVIIVTLLSTPENGIILLDQFPEEEQYTGA